MIIDSPIVSGSFLSTGSLSQIGNAQITGSLTVSGSAISLVDGSYSGSGANLFGIPATGITGLNLSQIASGSVSASISPSQGLLINTSVSASNFTGSFTGSLTGIATSASYASFALTSSYSLGGSGFPFSGSAVITGSLLVSGSAEITGSLSVSGSISASLFGTASQATSASYALTASYLLGYISPFPFTGSAEITGSLIVTGSVAISTLTTGSGVRYVIADQNGLLSAQTASAAIFTTQQVTSTAGQTTFPITNGYTTGYITVFVNGTKLSADEYVDTSGTNIVFLTGSSAGDNVEFQKYLPAAGVSNNTLRSTNYFTATTGQTNFSVNYTPGLIDIFYNGAKLDNTEYTAANGTSITLATASAAGDRLEVDVYSYQVGAFSGIGGTGAANQLAYFNTSNSITGSNAFTVSGSAIIITGSLIVSGSGTLINIGPAVFSGSVTAVGGFSGSFSGNADSASLAQNSLLLQGTGSIGFATTASLLAVSSSQQQISASLLNVVANYATTGSNSFRENQSITGSLVVSSTITAQTLVVQTVTSSIVYSSGSNVFGNSLSNTQTFTGSVNITGSLALAGNITGNAITLTGALGGTTADFLTTVGTRYLQIRDAGTSTPSLRSVNDTIAQLRAIAIEANTISLRTGASSGLTVTEALGISATGAATFSGTVNVYDGSSHGLSISNSSGAITFTNNWSKTTFTVGSAQDIEFNDDGGVKRLMLKNGGNVGIGTTNPVTNLEVVGSLGATGLRYSSSPAKQGVYLGNSSATPGTNDYATIEMCGGATGGCEIDFTKPGFDYRGRIGYETSADYMWFVTAANEKMRITSGGNIGIGTTNPTNHFEIKPGVASATLKVGGWAIMENVTTDQALFGRNVSYDAGAGSGWRSINTGYSTAIRMMDDYGDGSIAFLTNGSTSAGTSLTTWDSAGPKMVIRNGGNVGIGTTAPAELLHVYSAGTTGGNIRITDAGIANADWSILPSTGNTTAVYRIYNRAQAKDVFNASPTGTITFNQYGAGSLSTNSSGVISASDGRYKTKTRSVTNALDAVMQLNPTYYRWNEDNEFHTEYEELGFIAQEVASVIPEASPEPEQADRYKNYHDRAIIAVLTKAIQELQEKLQRNNIN